MIQRTAFLFLCALLLSPSVVLAAHFYDGNRLVEELREYEKVERLGATATSTQYYSAAWYSGYVVGVSDAINCPGSGKIKQVLAVVAKYLNEHPEEWGRPGAE